MKNRNKNKNIFHYIDYFKLVQKNNKVLSKDSNAHTNSNNEILKINLYKNNIK